MGFNSAFKGLKAFFPAQTDCSLSVTPFS